MREKFKDGDWIVGVGKNEGCLQVVKKGRMLGVSDGNGCSQVFDCDTDRPQPFFFLSDADPNNYRFATDDEIEEAKHAL